MKLTLQITLLAIVALAGTVRAQQATDENYANAARYKFGASRKDLSAIEATIRSAKPEQYKAIEEKLLALLKAEDTAVDAKRYFLRYLQTVGSEQSVATIATFLTDENLSHPARMALETMPSAAAGAALRNELSRGGAIINNGKAPQLIGIIGSVSARRDGAAVADLAKLAPGDDDAVVTATLDALGHIGTPDAARTLASIKNAKLGNVIVKAQLECATQLAVDGHKAEALEIFKQHLDPNTPKAQRVAALKGSMGLLDREESIKLVSESLQSGDPIMRVAALSAFSTSSDAAFKSSIVEQLPKLNPAAQLALLPILAQDATPAHQSLVAILEQSRNEDVRVAALQALPSHGEAADVGILMGIATKASDTEKDAARQALDRLSKPGVNDALIALLTANDAAAREVAVSSLAHRHAQAAIPVLMKLATGNDAAAATDAARSLDQLGSVEQVPDLVKIIGSTENDDLRSAAAQTAASLTNRAQDRQGAASAIIAGIESAKATPNRIALIRLLPRTRSAEALAAAVAQARSNDEAIREAAIRALADWPDISAATPLLEIAGQAADAKQGIIAAQGALRVAALKDAPIGARVSAYTKVLDLAKRPEEKKQALAGLAELPTPSAIKTLKQYTEDPALGSDAQQALKRLGSAGISKEGLILSWSMSGPYMQDNKDGAALFDVAFEPEKDPAKADWRLVIARNGMVEMDRLIGGDNRVGYLLCTITSPKAQDAILSCGSDDGVKAFLNGQVVLAKNVTRPAQPDQDRATIHLKEGSNTLLLKITQGGGQWAGVARLRGTDNQAIDITLTPGAD